MNKRTSRIVALTLVTAASLLWCSIAHAGNEITKQERMESIKEYVSEQFSSLKENEKEALVNDIFLEKFSDEAKGLVFAPNESDDFVDVAYQKMLERETYVVNLITANGGRDASFDNWDYNLDYLLAHYDELMELPNVNKVFIDMYIEDYNVVREARNDEASKINVIRTRDSSYVPMDAVTYAQTYYSNYNTAYPDWSYYGDCANFISQCLHAGGKNMVGTPGTSASAQNWSNWFSSGTSCNTNYVSSTWRGANAFKSYWSSNASSYSNFTSVGSSSYMYGFMGDAVSLLNSNGSAYHTLMIVGYDYANYDFVVAAHTNDTITAKLSDYSMPGGFIIFNMR